MRNIIIRLIKYIIYLFYIYIYLYIRFLIRHKRCYFFSPHILNIYEEKKPNFNFDFLHLLAFWLNKIKFYIRVLVWTAWDCKMMLASCNLHSSCAACLSGPNEETILVFISIGTFLHAGRVSDSSFMSMKIYGSLYRVISGFFVQNKCVCVAFLWLL